MLAACKAALQGLGPSSRSYGPGDKQLEAFSRSISDYQPDQIAAHVAAAPMLLTSSLRCHPARSTAWAVACTSQAHGQSLLVLLRELYLSHGYTEDSLPGLLNTPNKRGQTCLHVAASRGNAACVRFLLDHGCDVLRADKNGRNALHMAAAADSAECARILVAQAEALDTQAAAVDGSGSLEGPGSPGSPRNDGQDQLQQVQQQQWRSTLSLSLAGHRSPRPRSASARSRSQSPGAVAPSGRAQSHSGMAHQQQATAMSAVARLVNAADASNLTPLHFAAAANALEVARLLLGAGASLTVQASVDNFEASMPVNAGWTCLHVAAMRGHYDVANTIVRHHMSGRSLEDKMADWRPATSRRTADPRALADRRGTLACSLAAARGFPDVAKLLDPDTPLGQLDGHHVGPDGRELQPPAMFLCPITQEVMSEPVVASDGFTYERAAIGKWLSAGKKTSPMTNLPFASRLLFPNNVIKTAIKEWRQENQLPDPELQMARIGARARPASSGVVVDVNNAVGGGGLGGEGGGHRDPFLSHLRSYGL